MRPSLRSVADDPRHDQRFPDHPLSQVRRSLDEVSRSVEVGLEHYALAPFST